MNYEELTKKVEELEKELKSRPTKEELLREIRKDLSVYDNDIKTEKSLVLKQNAYIKNRKGIYDWVENVLAMNFNNTRIDKQNQIIIGSDKDENGNTISETNAVFISTKRGDFDFKDTWADIGNGSVVVESYNKDGEWGELQIVNRMSAIGDKEGIVVGLGGGGKNGMAGIGNIIEYNGQKMLALSFHTEKDDTSPVYNQHLEQYVDILPVTFDIIPSLGRKGYHYQQLVLRSPDGSSWSVKVDDSGNLTTTKL